MIAYLVTLTLVWAAGLMLYFIFLRRVPAHRFNRSFLLATTGVGLLVPLLPSWQSAPDYLPAIQALPEVWLPGLVVRAEGMAATPLATSDWSAYLLVVGYAVAAVALISSLVRLIRMHVTSRRIATEREMQIREVATDIAPCSFGRNLYVRNWSQLSPSTRETILTHESAHYQLGHAVDTSFMHVLCALMWFHPLAYLLRREIRLVHEFQADALTVRELDDQAYRTTLLAQQFGTQASAFTASFNQSPLNLRFMMMSSAFRQNQFWRLGAAALVLTLVAVACTKESIDESLLEDVAEVNTVEEHVAQEENQQKLLDELVTRGVAKVSVDTITVFDTETSEETVKIVRYYAWVNSGKPVDLAAMRSDKEGHSPDQSALSKQRVRGEQVYVTVDQMPRFPAPGCTEDLCAQKAMLTWIYTNVQYPTEALDAGIEGTAVVSFVVGRDGELLLPDVVRSVNPDIDAEVLRVVRAMPAWEPGKQDGEIVQVKFNLPIKFKLQG